jgi:hypothetical protein
MRPLDDLANDHAFCREVDTLAKDIHKSYKKNGSGNDIEMARCWVLALSSLLNKRGFVLESQTYGRPKNVLKLRDKN